MTHLALFEMGHTFRAPGGGSLLPDERDAVAVVFAGMVARRPVEPDRPVDVYDLSDVARALSDGLGLAAFEIDLDALLAGTRRDRAFRPLSRFPASNVDLAFVLDDGIAASSVVATLRAAGGAVVEDVRVFDEFRADALGAGRRSLAFAIRFRSPERTLTDDEVGMLRRGAIDAVVAAHGAELRG